MAAVLFNVTQGLDGPPGDKGDDGEAGQPVSAPFCECFTFPQKRTSKGFIVTSLCFLQGFPWTHWRVWSLWTTRKESK